MGVLTKCSPNLMVGQTCFSLGETIENATGMTEVNLIRALIALHVATRIYEVIEEIQVINKEGYEKLRVDAAVGA